MKCQSMLATGTGFLVVVEEHHTAEQMDSKFVLTPLPII